MTTNNSLYNKKQKIQEEQYFSDYHWGSGRSQSAERVRYDRLTDKISQLLCRYADQRKKNTHN